jgi:hypothetical protein
MSCATFLYCKRLKKPVGPVKVKVKLSLCLNWSQGHEGVLGSGGITPRILDLGTRWRWVVSFMLLLLYSQAKSPWYPMDRRLGGTQSRSERSGVENDSQPPSGLEPRSSSSISLSYPGSFILDQYEPKLNSPNV